MSALQSAGNTPCVQLKSHVTCTYLSGTEDVFVMPDRNITNLQLEIFGASGGAGTGFNNTLDLSSRGLGLHLQAKLIIDSIAPKSRLTIRVGVNGQDATENASGKATRMAGAGGDGGSCPASATVKRFAGAGGSATSVVSDHDGTTLVIAGGSGAGGWDKWNPAVKGTSYGRKAQPVQQDSKYQSSPRAQFLIDGNDASAILAGRAGIGADGGEDGVELDTRGMDLSKSCYDQWARQSLQSGGNGGSARSGSKVCMAAGGGSGGYNGGGGGGATNVEGAFNRAGAGGSGSSVLSNPRGNPSIVIESQEHRYVEDPRVRISYDLPKDESSDCNIM